jgi:hypothetical protein
VITFAKSQTDGFDTILDTIDTILAEYKASTSQKSFYVWFSI